MRGQIRVFILKALRAAGDQPMTEPALVVAVMLAYPSALVTEVRGVLAELEGESFIAGAQDGLSGLVSYGLTLKGSVKANQL